MENKKEGKIRGYRVENLLNEVSKVLLRITNGPESLQRASPDGLSKAFHPHFKI